MKFAVFISQKLVAYWQYYLGQSKLFPVQRLMLNKITIPSLEAEFSESGAYAMGALNKCTKMTNTYIHIKYNVHQIFFLWSKVCILFLRIKFRWQFNCTKNLNVIRKIIYVPKKINLGNGPHNSSFSFFWRIKLYGCPNALNLDGFCPIRQQIMSARCLETPLHCLCVQLRLANP